jgi:hypothetical protein
MPERRSSARSPSPARPSGSPSNPGRNPGSPRPTWQGASCPPGASALSTRGPWLPSSHLYDLARAANPVAPKRHRPAQQRIRPAVQRILESITAPAVVRNSRLDYVAANPLGRALYAPLFDSREQPANSARFTFLDPAAQDFYADWERVAKDLVAHLRSEAGRNPYDRGLSDLVGELSTRSQEFRNWWAAHNVRFHQTGRKRLRHPIVGELQLSYEVMEMSADTGLTIAVYSAEPGSASQQALDLLASWTATPAHERAGARET